MDMVLDSGDDNGANNPPNTNVNDPNARGENNNLLNGRPPPQDGMVARAIYDFLHRVCSMSPDGAYLLVVTHGDDGFDTLRFL